MRLFVDANILVSVLNKEYPLFTHTSRILSLAGQKGFEVYTSPICLAIAFYFAEKKYKAAKAKEKIGILCKHIGIAEANEDVVQNALKNSAVLDFEDGLEYYSALKTACDCIITEDVGDFHFSKIEVLQSEAFFEKYLLKKRIKS
jgi:predicted nucleic acid-binding protein